MVDPIIMGEEFDPPFGGDGDFSGGIFHFGGMILAKKGYEKAGKRWHYDVICFRAFMALFVSG